MRGRWFRQNVPSIAPVRSIAILVCWFDIHDTHPAVGVRDIYPLLIKYVVQPHGTIGVGHSFWIVVSVEIYTDVELSDSPTIPKLESIDEYILKDSDEYAKSQVFCCVLCKG